MNLLMGVLCASLVGGTGVFVLGTIFWLCRRKCGARYRKIGWILIALCLLLPLDVLVFPGLYTLEIPNIVLRQGDRPRADESVNDAAGTVSVPGISDVTGVSSYANSPNLQESMGQTPPTAAYGTGEITTITVLLLLWVSVALLLTILYVVGFWQMHRKNMRWSRECQDEGILKLASGISVAYGLRRVPQIRILELSDQGPFTVGLRRKIIFLPEKGLLDRDVEYILRHEMVHCREHDIFWKTVFVAVNIVHWFNPFVWLLRRLMEQDMEVVCDDTVLDHASMEQREEYSNVIMAWIERSQSKHQWNAFSTGYVTRHRFVRRRFASIFDDTNKKRGRVFVAAAVAVLALTSVAIHVEAGERALSQQRIPIDAGIEVRTDVNGDGETERVYVTDTVSGDYAFTQVAVNYGRERHDVTFINYDDDFYSSMIIVGDLSGNGAADIVVVKYSIGSTYGGCAVSVLHVVDEKLVEYPCNFITNPALEIEQPENFANDFGGMAYIGATIIERDGRTLLRFVSLEDKWEEKVLCLDCSYRQDGWFIENAEFVDNYYTDNKDVELLGEMIVY